MRWLVLVVAMAAAGCEKKPAKPSHPPKTHRASAEKCPDTPHDQHAGPTAKGDCKANTDCTAGKNGLCVDHYIGQGDFSAECEYDTCFSDADCPKGPCLCGGAKANNHCGHGECKTDADCKGSYCSPSPDDCNWGTKGWYCHTAKDECVDDSDCTKDGKGEGEGYCWLDEKAGHWACRYGRCMD